MKIGMGVRLVGVSLKVGNCEYQYWVMSGHGSNRRYIYQHIYFYIFLPTYVFLNIFTNFMRTGVTRRPTRSQPKQLTKSCRKVN